MWVNIQRIIGVAHCANVVWPDLAGEAVETLKRDQRAAIDALRLDVEVLKRCLLQVHPELGAHVEAMRATLIREFDPEAS
jgi:hypothetical protein